MSELRYETAAMAELRAKLTEAGHTDAEVDIFRTCLIVLERQGFTLVKRDQVRFRG